jgi:hypothetical protein
MIVKRYRKVDFFFRMLHAAHRIGKVNAAAAADRNNCRDKSRQPICKILPKNKYLPAQPAKILHE